VYPFSAPRLEFDLQRYAALLDLADLVSRYHEPRDLFPELARRLRMAFPFDFLNFAVHDPLRNTMKMHLWTEGAWPTSMQEFAVEETVAGFVWQTQQVVVIDDVKCEKRFSPDLRLLCDHNVRSYTAFPLTALGQRMGALGFGIKRNWVFTTQDVEFLRRAAEIVALGVYNAQSRESALILAMESGRAHRALQLLQEIDASLAENLNLQQHMSALSRCIHKVIPHDHAGVGICEPDGKTLRVVALDPLLNAMLAGAREGIPLQEKVLTDAFLNRSTAILGHADLAAMRIPVVDRALEMGIRSVCCAPMITANGPMGVLGLASRAENVFTPQDLNLLKQISSAIALWMENALIQESAQKEKARLQALFEIDAALSQFQADFRHAFPTISRSTEKIVRHDLAIVNVVDRASGTLRVYTWSGQIADRIALEDMTVPIDETLASQILEPREGQILTAEELKLLASRLPTVRYALENGIQSACFVPLVTSVGTIGSLFLARSDQSTFAEEDVQFLKRLAPEMAFALENSLAQHSLVREKKKLQVLREIDGLLVSKLELEKLLPAVSACLADVIPHHGFAVCIYDATVSGLRVFSIDSEMEQNIIPEGAVVSLEDTLTGRIFMAQKTRVYDYDEMLHATSPLTQRALELGVRSACLVPLITPQGPLGVMTLFSKTDRAFLLESMDILEQAGASIALTLENVLSHRALEREKERLLVLLRTGSSVAGRFDVQRGFPKISAYVRRLKRHEFASLTLRDFSKNFYQHILDFPLGKGILLPDSNMSIEASPVEKTLEARTPLIFSREAIAAFDCKFSSDLLQEGIKSLCCVPLNSSNEISGTLNLGSTRDDAFKPEDFSLLLQVATQIAVALENERANREIKQLKTRLTQEKQYLEGEIRTELHFEEIVGDSPALKRVLEQVATVAASDATVLILGETGTGKELIARAIHRLSLRKQANFVKVNCAAIPTGLLESELFGHEKGAFTGAVSQKIGRLELADHGTLFLDEVGEIALDIQPKLLRVLQDQEFERLGGVKTTKVNLRLIAATNRDMTKSVSEHEFRSDLFYRLNVFPIRMPPLRDRREDIPMLVRHFVRKYASRMNRNIENISAETINLLTNWQWPGNVRELENFMERSVILSEGPSLQAPLAELRATADAVASSGDTLDDADREHIIRVLRESGGLISGPNGAASRLGLKRTTLQSKMQRLGIVREDYLGRQRA
jgi:formate hydrogenlyase transcriptional activator